MRSALGLALAIAMLGLRADPAVAGGQGVRVQGGASQQVLAHPHQQHGHTSREGVRQDAPGPQGKAHAEFGGPRLEQRPDPNYQNPYRPMFSLDAVNPGETHPYFQTRKEGFGYPVGRPLPVYLGNGTYFIPR